MSPCERYVMTYSPKGDAAFSVWNFQLVELIRDFQAEFAENQDTYKWSFDGNYIAKRFRTETTKDGQKKVKEGISVYELPSMQLLSTEDGSKKSITIEGIEQWNWAPHRNLLIYTCFYQDAADKDKTKSSAADPRVGFMKIPSRQQIGTTNFKGSEKLIMYIHPQGYYVAIANLIAKKKSKEWVVEIFDIEKGDMVPHQ
jgi:uncharacterized protein with WD repeat